MIEMYTQLCSDYPIVSIEQPFDKDDWEHAKLFSALGICQVVGDDLLMSSPKRIEQAIQESACNALLLKINQIGTVTEAIEVVEQAKDAQWGVIISHRSGETEDSILADFTVGLAAGQIKSLCSLPGESELLNTTSCSELRTNSQARLFMLERTGDRRKPTADTLPFFHCFVVIVFVMVSG
ncbi:putative phosphopyruvate hydratase [Dioscorea sansibarensis]